MPSSTAGFSRAARAPSVVSGRAATKSARVGATGSAGRRATHSTRPCEGSWHEPLHRSRQTPDSRQTDAVQADPPRHRAPNSDRRMAAGSPHPVRAPAHDALWLLANDSEQGTVGTDASRSYRAAAAGWHICAPSQIPVSCAPDRRHPRGRSEEHTSELQSHLNLVCRLLLEKKKKKQKKKETKKKKKKKKKQKKKKTKN